MCPGVVASEVVLGQRQQAQVAERAECLGGQQHAFVDEVVAHDGSEVRAHGLAVAAAQFAEQAFVPTGVVFARGGQQFVER